MRKKLGALFIGLIFIGVAVGYAGNALGLWSDFSIFFDGFWTLFIIIPCLYSLIADGWNTFTFAAALLFGAILCSKQGLFDFTLVSGLFVPLVLVFVGITIIVSAFRTRKTVVNNDGGFSSHDGNTAFAENKFSYDGQSYSGGTYKCEFGSQTIDLRGADIADGAVITADVSFGGMKIILPDDVGIEVLPSSFFGGVSNKHGANGTPAKRITLRGSCSFGGIEIV